MSDIIFEMIRVLILLYAFVYLAKAGKNRSELCRKGWRIVLAGFGLLVFANAMDVTDNFESLNRFVVIGDTPAQAFLEKMVGFMCGFLFLAIGLIRWIPTITGVERIEQIIESGEGEMSSTHPPFSERITRLKLIIDKEGLSDLGGFNNEMRFIRYSQTGE